METFDFQTFLSMVSCFTIAGLLVGGFAWWRLRCPNCNRVFTRQVVDRQTTRKELLVFKAEERLTYQCRRCDHVWYRDVRYDND
jgi:phage terminase large subunit GpA-like protein